MSSRRRSIRRSQKRKMKMNKEKNKGMRYLKVPAPAKTKGLLNVEECPFDAFFTDMCFPLINKKSGDAVRIAKQLLNKLVDCEEGQVIPLTDEEHEVFLNALPGDGVPGRLQVRLIDHYDAVAGASSENPEANGASKTEAPEEKAEEKPKAESPEEAPAEV